MAATIEGTIENNTNSTQYKFRAIANFKDKTSQPPITIPFVGQTPEENFNFRWSGQSGEISFSFAIFNDGVDTSNGANQITIDEQISYLKTFIYTPEFDTEWTFTQSRYFPSGVQCLITNLEFDNQVGGVSLVTGTITLQLGVAGVL